MERFAWGVLSLVFVDELLAMAALAMASTRDGR